MSNIPDYIVTDYKPYQSVLAWANKSDRTATCHKKAIEALSHDFAAEFWEFVKAAQYDIASFCQLVETDMPDANLIKDRGLRRITPKDLLERLNSLFTKSTQDTDSRPNDAENLGDIDFNSNFVSVTV